MKLIKEAYSPSMPNWLKKYDAVIKQIRDWDDRDTIDFTKAEFIDYGQPKSNRDIIFSKRDCIRFFEIKDLAHNYTGLLVKFPSGYIYNSYGGVTTSNGWKSTDKLNNKDLLSVCLNCCYIEKDIDKLNTEFRQKRNIRRIARLKRADLDDPANRFTRYNDKLGLDKSGYYVPNIMDLKNRLLKNDKIISKLSKSLKEKMQILYDDIMKFKFSFANILDNLDIKMYDPRIIKDIFHDFSICVNNYRKLLINISDDDIRTAVYNLTESKRALAEAIKLGESIGLSIDADLLTIDWDDENMYTDDEV